jgi:ferrous iron transport protein B
MATASPPTACSIALVGNPNTGKSTLFNALSGARQRTGNYPGCTVEKKLGQMESGGRKYTLIDLPGTYSLAPRSPDEMVTVDVLLGRRLDVERPSAIVCILDASNLERNLYLLSQVLELGLPTVVALNMLDVAKGKGIQLDLAKLKARLPVPIVPIQANQRVGMADLKAAIAAAVESPPFEATSPFPEAFQREVTKLEALSAKQEALPRYLVERLLLDTTGYLREANLPGVDDSFLSHIDEARTRLKAAGQPIPAIEAMSRYRWAGETLVGVVSRPSKPQITFSDRIDAVLTHRFLGTLIFAFLMLVVFQAVFWVAEPASKTVDWLMGMASGVVAANLAEGPLRSLLINGVIGGVGGVIVFLPQIFTLFLFIALLEDCGYMARAAYLMDKLMTKVGLSGKSFIPLLSSFACAIPGILSARVIENRRDRLTTILIAPLMSCSARLPVYQLMISSFVPQREFLGGWLKLQGLVLFGMYLLGIVTAVLVAWLLKLTILRGPTPPFVMELPSYKRPGLGVVIWRMLEQGWEFLYRAGTLILAVSIIIWALGYFPHREADISPALLSQHQALAAQLDAAPPAEKEALADQLAAVDNQIQGEHLRNSYLGRFGQAIEPAVRPLGWDWRIGCAAIASFPAREVVVATLGVIYNLGEGVDEESPELNDALKHATWHGTDRPVFTLATALSVMVFFALCAQCASTLAVMKRETGSWFWPAFTFVYMTSLAYVGSLATYQIASRLWPGL